MKEKRREPEERRREPEEKAEPQPEMQTGKKDAGRPAKRGLASRELSWRPAGRERRVLEHMTLTFEPGYIYGIIGPNGSGKSSFLKHVMGFLPVQEGSLLWGEQPVGKYRKRELARTVSFVPQETRLDTDFSAYEIVMTGRNPYQKRFGAAAAEDMEKVQEALAFTRCEALAEQSFASLSGGEAQRVIIARAVAQDTEWMVLDEPVASLDIRNQVELMERLKSLNREKGTSILMVLHDINLASAYCDRLVMLKGGRVLFAGDTREALTCQRLEELYEIGFQEADAGGRRMFYPRVPSVDKGERKQK